MYYIKECLGYSGEFSTISGLQRTHIVVREETQATVTVTKILDYLRRF